MRRQVRPKPPEPLTVATLTEPVVDHHQRPPPYSLASLYQCSGSWSTRTFAPRQRVISELVQHDDAERHGEHRLRLDRQDSTSAEQPRQ